MADITITYVPEWRRKIWDADVPSRPAWLVNCPEHQWVGHDSSGQPWGYATSGRASGVVARHRKAYHRDQH